MFNITFNVTKISIEILNSKKDLSIYAGTSIRRAPLYSAVSPPCLVASGSILTILSGPGCRGRVVFAKYPLLRPETTGSKMAASALLLLAASSLLIGPALAVAPVCIAGYGFHPYEPLCAESCLRFFSGYMLGASTPSAPSPSCPSPSSSSSRSKASPAPARSRPSSPTQPRSSRSARSCPPTSWWLTMPTSTAHRWSSRSAI